MLRKSYLVENLRRSVLRAEMRQGQRDLSYFAANMILSAVLGFRALASNLNQSECFFPELATLGFSRRQDHMENRG